MSQMTHGRALPPSWPLGLTVAHLLARILGFASVALAVAIPMLAKAYPHAELAPTPISAGLLAAGAYHATRPRPRRVAAAVAATLLMPVGSVVFMFGAIAVSDVGAIEPDTGKMAAGAMLLVVAVGAGWTAWGSPTERRMQAGVQSLAVGLLIVVAAISVQTMVEPGPRYIEPVAFELIGSDVIVEIPFQGGCGTSHLIVGTELHDKLLEVSVTERATSFRCRSTCAAGSHLLCTDTVEQRLDRQPPYGTVVVAAGRAPTGLRRLPLGLLLGGVLVGAVLWCAGRSEAGYDAGDHDHETDD